MTSGRLGGGFAVVLFLTTALLCAPANWLGWTGDVADVVRAPIMPVSRMGTSIANWMRPPRDGLGRPIPEGEIEQLRDDRDRYEQLWLSQRVRADELARRLRQFEGLSDQAHAWPRPPLVLSTDVTGRDPTDPRSAIELRMPKEGGSRLRVGDVVVWRGRLLGRLSHVSPMRLVVLPISNPESGSIEVAVAEEGEPSMMRRLLLRQDDSGGLSAEVDRRIPIAPGARLVLADERWPAWAHGYQVAVVDRVESFDEAPLRQKLTARPAVDAPAVSRVLVLPGLDEEVLP